MRYFIPRLLKALLLALVLSLLTAGLAEDGLVGEVVDTVENVLVDQEETSDETDESLEVEQELVDTKDDSLADGESETGEVTESTDGTSLEVDEDMLVLDGEDKYLTVENELLESTAEDAGLVAVGEFAYDLQEYTLHGNITKLTGKKVDHYYVWVCIGNVCLPVDPFTASN